jgi:hypothetical protein
LTDAWKYTVEDAAVTGQQYVISPWLDDSYRKDIDGLKRFRRYSTRAVNCVKIRNEIRYHNHDFEFNTMVGGMRSMILFLKN